MAGELAPRAMVWVGPPLSASGPRRGLVLATLPLPLRIQVVPSSTLPPMSKILNPTRLQFPPDGELAIMLLARINWPYALSLKMPPPSVALLPLKVLLVTVIAA